jgi:hypothetical protein
VADTEERSTQSTDEPSEEELRAALEEQMRKVRVEDLLLQSVAGQVNLSARRIAKEDERDLAQAKVGIDAVRALVDLLPGEAAREVRNALSELQVLYANAVKEQERPEGEPEVGNAAPEEGATPERGGEPPRPERGRPGPGEPPPRLWTPPGST